MADDIAKSKLKRSLLVGKTVSHVGLIKAKSKAKALFQSSEQNRISADQTDQEIAQILFDGLCQLRGTALKLAQSLCGETDWLPPQYLQQLEKAQYRVPPLSAAVVRKVFQNEFDMLPEKMFKEFTYAATAAASLGQVHKAVLKTGETVAVKIQYPGVNQTIVHDMTLAKAFARRLSQGGLLVNTLAEIESRLQEEIDYRHEYKNLQQFAELKMDVAQIPKGFAEFSSEHILTTTWVEGVHIDAWLRSNPTSADRESVAQRLFSFFNQSVFQHGLLHGDPNHGNFIVQKNLGLAVLDFGCVKQLDEQTLRLYRSLWQIDPLHKTQILELYKNLGAQFSDESKNDFWTQAVEPYISWIGRARESSNFKFTEEYLQQGKKIFSSQARHPALQNFSPHFTFLHRTLYGLFRIFSQMNVSTAVLL